MLNVKYTHKCDICGKEFTEEHKLLECQLIPNPSWPEGWLVIEGLKICDKHAIGVFVDGSIVVKRGDQDENLYSERST